ncbi:MAG: glycine cleavage system aminomethyltransferase GcvT [Betaproteobacteria bacterium]|nr:glycine cleavage system aminomethyltransferase GcvT [Betaproteobacteria bacterium]
MAQSAQRTTPLNAVHHALGARMVAFAGWEMPIAYGSQLEEHHRVRRDAGMFDVSHMLVVDLRGGQARAFLQRLLANDAAKLAAAGRALYSCLLDRGGGVLDDLIVYFLGGERYRLVVNAGTAEKDCAWIAARRDECAPEVTIEPRRDFAIVAVQGPRAREKTWDALPHLRAASERLAPFHAAESDGTLIARTGYTGEDGFEIMLPAAGAVALWQALAGKDVAPAGLGARDTLRLEAGLNLYGQDMDETVTPMEAGLAWTVALDGGRDFIGRAALLGRAPRWRQLGLLLLEPGVMRGRQKVRGGWGAGEITSGGYSPTLNRSIALARLPRAAAAGEEVEVEVRGKWLRARTVAPPFVRHGKVLISAEC